MSWRVRVQYDSSLPPPDLKNNKKVVLFIYFFLGEKRCNVDNCAFQFYQFFSDWSHLYFSGDRKIWEEDCRIMAKKKVRLPVGVFFFYEGKKKEGLMRPTANSSLFSKKKYPTLPHSPHWIMEAIQGRENGWPGQKAERRKKPILSGRKKKQIACTRKHGKNADLTKKKVKKLQPTKVNRFFIIFSFFFFFHAQESLPYFFPFRTWHDPSYPLSIQLCKWIAVVLSGGWSQVWRRRRKKGWGILLSWRFFYSIFSVPFAWPLHLRCRPWSRWWWWCSLDPESRKKGRRRFFFPIDLPAKPSVPLAIETTTLQHPPPPLPPKKERGRSTCHRPCFHPNQPSSRKEGKKSCSEPWKSPAVHPPASTTQAAEFAVSRSQKLLTQRKKNLEEKSKIFPTQTFLPLYTESSTFTN